VRQPSVFLLLLLLVFCNSSLPAQNKYNFSQFESETWSFVKQPTRWDGGDWLRLGLTGAGTFLVMQADQPIRNAVQRDHRYSKSTLVESGRVYGELYSPVAFFGGFAVYSLLTDDEGTKKIAYEIGQASLYAGATTYLLKMAIGRARPYVNEGPKSFHPFSSVFFKQDYQSLPGGHSTVAFVISTVLSRNVTPAWLKGVMYIPAAMTFVSRVYQDQHWTSDDLFGALLGYFIATWVVDQHENGEARVRVSSLFPLSISIALN
jgi:hypothetical protein